MRVTRPLHGPAELLLPIWETDVFVDARRSLPMAEHGIAIKPGHLVVLDRSSDPPRIVYRWSDITVASDEGGYTLTQDGARVDPEHLCTASFPRIRSMYENMQ